MSRCPRGKGGWCKSLALFRFEGSIPSRFEFILNMNGEKADSIFYFFLNVNGEKADSIFYFFLNVNGEKADSIFYFVKNLNSQFFYLMALVRRRLNPQRQHGHNMGFHVGRDGGDLPMDHKPVRGIAGSLAKVGQCVNPIVG